MSQKYRIILKNNISSMVNLDDQSLEMVVDQFKIQSVGKNEHLLTGGQVCKKLYFIIQGLARVYYFQDEKEVTTFLSADNCFIASPSSFLRQEVSNDFIQCLEDSVIASISYHKMEELHGQIPAWNAISRRFTEQHLLCLSERFLKQHNVKAKDKYLRFLSTSPTRVVQRTPIQHIASFLGITPESLSRIRKELASEISAIT